MRGGAVLGRVHSASPVVRGSGISVSDYVEMMASSLWPVYLLGIFKG